MINNGEIPLGYKIDHINGVRSDNRLSIFDWLHTNKMHRTKREK
ncbi:HNH endonuclease [Escherichia coli]|nr:HNH endonuclease [Escherichia coli]